MPQSGKTIVFIDGANVHHATKALDFRIDWNRFREYFKKEYNILRFYYYTALNHVADDPVVRLTDWLSYNGYVVRSKPVKVQGERYKGNMDVELVVDALSLVGFYDHAVIISGDGDLCCLVEALQFKGIRVTVIQSRISGTTGGIAPELIKQADEFIELDELKGEIRRMPGDTEEPNGNQAELP